MVPYIKMDNYEKPKRYFCERHNFWWETAFNVACPDCENEAKEGSKMETPAMLDFLEEVLPKVEEYRAKQINKYYREKELDWGGDSGKMERYKNRVRIVDTFLGPLKKLVTGTDSVSEKNID